MLLRQHCFGKHDHACLVTCDYCEEQYHTYCVTPILSKVPTGTSWYCQHCQVLAEPPASCDQDEEEEEEEEEEAGAQAAATDDQFEELKEGGSVVDEKQAGGGGLRTAGMPHATRQCSPTTLCSTFTSLLGCLPPAAHDHFSCVS